MSSSHLSAWQINTKYLNLLTTFHNKRGHSFQTKERAAPMNTTTIDQKEQKLQVKKTENCLLVKSRTFTKITRLSTGDFGGGDTSGFVGVWISMALGYFRRGGIVFAASGNLHQTLAWVYVIKAAIWWLRKTPFPPIKCHFHAKWCRKLSKVNWLRKRSTSTIESLCVTGNQVFAVRFFFFRSVKLGF